MAKPRSTRVDWDAVKRDFRSGKHTQVQLADKHGIDPATLSRKIKKDRLKDPKAWPQDLSEAIQQETNAALAASLVKTEVNDQGQVVNSKVNADQAKAVIAAAVATNIEIITRHRTRVERATGVAMRMLDELDATTLKQGELEELFKLAAAEADNPLVVAGLVQRFKDHMRLHARVGSVHKLMEAISKAQALEREAFSLDKPVAADQQHRQLSDAERASRLATILERARQRAAAATPALPAPGAASIQPVSNAGH